MSPCMVERPWKTPSILSYSERNPPTSAWRVSHPPWMWPWIVVSGYGVWGTAGGTTGELLTLDPDGGSQVVWGLVAAWT